MEMKVVKPPFCSQPVVPGLCPGPRLSRRRTHCWAAVIGSGLASAAAGAGRLITHNIVKERRLQERRLQAGSVSPVDGHECPPFSL